MLSYFVNAVINYNIIKIVGIIYSTFILLPKLYVKIKTSNISTLSLVNIIYLLSTGSFNVKEFNFREF
jgi:hypothetical protein